LAEALEARAGGPPPPPPPGGVKPAHMMPSLVATREAKRAAAEARVARQADWGAEGRGGGVLAADAEAREEAAAAFATGTTPLHSLAAEVLLDTSDSSLKAKKRRRKR
jgi:hypothetical protein